MANRPTRLPVGAFVMTRSSEKDPRAKDPVWRLAVRNELSAAGSTYESLEVFLKSANVNPDVAFPVLLALEEVLTNIIKYGYDDDLEHEILVEARVFPGEILLETIDDGHEFDPLGATLPDLDSPVEDRSIGGLGIHLLRNLSQRLSYERVGGKNVLSLSFLQHPRNRERNSGDPHASQD